MKEKIQLVQDMFNSGNMKEASILTLEVCAELAIRLDAVEHENQRIRESLGMVAGKAPTKTAGGNGFSIG